MLKAIARITEVGLRLNTEKSKIAVTVFIGMGHLISTNGVRIDPERAQYIEAVPLQEPYAVLHTFISMTGFFRKHIRDDYTMLVNPLVKLLTTEGWSGQSKPSKRIGLTWTEEAKSVLCIKTRSGYGTVIKSHTTRYVNGYYGGCVHYGTWFMPIPTQI